MDSKMIERFLTEVLTIDQDMKRQLDHIESEIIERELQLKVLLKEIDEGSHRLEKENAQRILDRVQTEWTQKLEVLRQEGQALIEKHNSTYDSAEIQLVNQVVEEMDWWK
ncbi:MAG: hypothetical protein LCH34_02760 [Firmicutes bacterium]|nr:hypothetical protein [Bacillota bacterium]